MGPCCRALQAAREDRVDDNCADDGDALQRLLCKDGDLEQLQDIVDFTQQDGAERRPIRCPRAAKKTDAAHHGSGDGRQVIARPRRGIHVPVLCRVEQAAEPGQRAAHDKGLVRAPAHGDRDIMRCFRIGAHGVKVTPPTGEAQDHAEGDDADCGDPDEAADSQPGGHVQLGEPGGELGGVDLGATRDDDLQAAVD